jgi:cephalosporin hydroxylase
MAFCIENSIDVPLAKVLDIMQDRIVFRTSYLGVPTLKNPLDFWVYQEIIFARKPNFIVEIGNRFGGSTLALAHLCDLIGDGNVIAIDISHDDIYPQVRSHPRITLLEGDACSLVEDVRKLISINDRVMVIEDSSHTYENTLNVLNAYCRFVKSGDYFIVEDGICHHGLDVGPSPGPYESIEHFIDQNSEFEIDREKESFIVTWNPKGFLRRK